MIHGFGASSFTWRRWVPTLARSYRVIVADLKGFGASPKPRDDHYSPHDLTRGVVDLIRGDDMDDLVLIGHSLGGGVSLLAALQLLDLGELRRLRGLSLISSAAFPQRLPPFISAARLPALGVAGLTLLPIHWIVGLILRAIVFDRTTITGEMVKGYAEPLSHRDGRYGLIETAREIIPSDLNDVTARFSELDLPVHLLWGENDRVVPPWVGDRLRQVLPRAHMHTLARCGHLPQEEHPEVALGLLREFLEGDAASP